MPASVDKLLNSQYVQLALAALAFLIALWFVVVIARMLMGGRLRLPGGRTRQARLGIVDAFDLDRQRQLIIVRRDNTEHLIMIGGPNDLVIESEIVRVEARDVRDRRDKGSDGDPRAAEPRLQDLRLSDPRLADARRAGLDGTAGSNGAAPPVRSEEPFLALPSSPTIQPIAPVAPAASSAASPAASEPLGLAADAAEPMARPPTFPLPPRRPNAPPSPPERRVQPTLAPPDRTRASEPPPLVPEGEASVAPPPATPPLTTPPQSSGAAPQAPGAPPQAAAPPRPAPVLVPADRPVPARPSPFLKPLPPRPPIRPLRRTTPQAEPVLPAAGAPAILDPAAPPPATPPEPRPPQAAAPRPVAASDPAPNDGSEEKNGLESLEEEMAKLLGR